MRRLLLGALLVASATLPGCLSGDFLGAPEIEVRTAANELVPFSYTGTVDPTDPPMNPDQAYQSGNVSMSVPDGALRLSVQYSVTFQEATPTSPPSEFQRVEVTLIDPEGRARENLTATQAVEGEWEFEDPMPGTWELGYRARGQGSLFLLGLVTVEVQS